LKQQKAKLLLAAGFIPAFCQVWIGISHAFLQPSSVKSMLRVTKIFRFETAHAIYGYNGSCRNVHGHSYELHVTVQQQYHEDEYLPAPGFVIDFKDLKRIVHFAVIDRFDHCIILSEDYLQAHPFLRALPNLEVWQAEPTAENILLYIKNKLLQQLPEDVVLHELKLYETADSYAEWTAQ
jgi:6-pyruvoyltetrahydropterin/6-carboxytetrahydropterin synthase